MKHGDNTWDTHNETQIARAFNAGRERCRLLRATGVTIRVVLGRLCKHSRSRRAELRDIPGSRTARPSSRRRAGAPAVSLALQKRPLSRPSPSGKATRLPTRAGASSPLGRCFVPPAEQCIRDREEGRGEESESRHFAQAAEKKTHVNYLHEKVYTFFALY